MSKGWRRIAVRIPPEMEEALSKVAEEEGCTKSEAVREAIRRYIAERRLKRFEELRREGAKYFEEAGFETEEDVLKAVS